MGASGNEPFIERRSGHERRDEPNGGLAWAAKWIGNPLSLIAMLIALVATAISTARNANEALPRSEYQMNRLADSLKRDASEKERSEQFLVLQNQIADMKAEIILGNARTDSIVRLLRRSVCRANPDACP